MSDVGGRTVMTGDDRREDLRESPLALSTCPPQAAEGEFESARQVFVSFARSSKTIQLYPANNKLFVAAVDDFHRTIVDFHVRFGELTLAVEETRILYKNLTMYEEPVRARSIPYRLFCDGVRRLSILPGLTREELIAFLDVLGHPPAPDDVEDDIVTQLWSREFVHIHYYVVDPDAAEEQREPDLHRRLKAAEVPETPVDQPAENAEARPKRAVRALSAESLGQILAITEQDQKVLRGLLEQDSRRDIRHDLATLLFEMLSICSDDDAFRNCVGILGLLLKSYLEAGDAHLATDVLRTFHGLAAGDVGEPRRSIVASQIELSHAPENIAALGKLLSGGGSRSMCDVMAFIDLLSPDASSALVDLIPCSPDPQFVSLLVRKISTGDPARLFERLSDRDTTIVRRIIAAIASMGNPDHADWILSQESHPDPSVRIEVVRALAKIGGARALDALSRALNDGDTQVRLGVLRAVGEHGDSAILPCLMGYAESRVAAGRQFFEQQEILKTVARVGRDDVLPWLTRHVDQRGWLGLGRKDQWRSCAAAALGHIRTPAARRAVEERLETAKGMVAEALRASLRRLDADTDSEREGPRT